MSTPDELSAFLFHNVAISLAQGNCEAAGDRFAPFFWFTSSDTQKVPDTLDLAVNSLGADIVMARASGDTVTCNALPSGVARPVFDMVCPMPLADFVAGANLVTFLLIERQEVFDDYVVTIMLHPEMVP